MTIAATAWAFATDAPRVPLERLLLIMLADDADDFGVCVTNLERVAEAARISSVEMGFLLDRMRERDLLRPLRQVVPDDPDFDLFDVLMITGWAERRPLPDGRHPVYGAVVCQ